MSVKIKKSLIEYQLKYSQKKDYHEKIGIGNTSALTFLTESYRRPMPRPSTVFPSSIYPKKGRPYSSYRGKKGRSRSPTHFTTATSMDRRESNQSSSNPFHTLENSVTTFDPQKKLNFYELDQKPGLANPDHTFAPPHRKEEEEEEEKKDGEEEEKDLNTIEKEATSKYLRLKYLVQENSTHLQKLVTQFEKKSAVHTDISHHNNNHHLQTKLKNRPKSAKSFAKVIRGMDRDIERQRKNYRMIYELLSEEGNYEEYYRNNILSPSQLIEEEGVNGRHWNERFIHEQTLSPEKKRPQSAVPTRQTVISARK